jgi:hypothetical protein
MSESGMVASAQEAIGSGEKVEAAGVFQPRGTEGAITAAGAIGAVAGGPLAAEEGVPRWTLIAVTPQHLYAFGAELALGGGVKSLEPFMTFERDKIAITVHGRLGVRTFEVEDTTSGRRFEWEAQRFSPMHGSVVVKLLQQES